MEKRSWNCLQLSLRKFLSSTDSYCFFNRSFCIFGLGVSLNLGPVELYCLTDNILAWGMLNPSDNLAVNSQSINVDTRKVKNGQIHFGMNLTFGRDKKVKPGEEVEEDRAAPVSNDGDTETADPKGSTETKNGVQGVKRKTVYGNTEVEPKRTDYNEGSKGNRQLNLSQSRVKSPNQNQIIIRKLKLRKTKEKVLWFQK